MTRSLPAIACALAWVLVLLLGVATPAAAAVPDRATANLPADPWASFDDPWFDRVGIAEGLPQSVTTALAQDSRGLIWIGTVSGLARYDGYRMQSFDERRPGTPGLPDAYVRALLPLADGGVLVGTNASGLTRFDPRTNTFHDYPVGAGRARTNGTADGKIYALVSARDGGAWIATDRGLDHLDLTSGQINHVATGSETAGRNFSVREDSQGNLWLGNDRGLFVRYAGTRNFVRPQRPDGDADVVLSNQIWALYEDHAGRIWAGSGQAGAAYRDTDGHWHAVPGFSGYVNNVQRVTVRDFVQVGPDTIWIGTDGAGVLAYRLGQTTVGEINHDPAKPSSLPGNTVRALLDDRSDNVWVATDLGATRTDRDARAAFSLLPSDRNAHALASNNVRSIFVDSRGRIWLGLGAGGVDVIDLASGAIHHLHLGGAQSRRDVQAFAESADGAIWVGTQGLARIDPDSYAVQPSVLDTLWNTPVLSLANEDAGHLLIGTYDGVYRYNLGNQQLEHFAHLNGDDSSLVGNTVRTIARIGSRIWYGTTHGISVADRVGQSGGFHNLSHGNGDPASLPNDFIGSISEDRRGRLWVSTFDGIGVIDQVQRGPPYRSITLGEAQGLASAKINSSVADDAGNVWASMANGIARIDGNSLTAHNLSARDGLHIASYVSTAAARAPDGSLLFGGLGGLTVVRPSDQMPDYPAAPLAITQAKFNDRLASFGELPQPGGQITLKDYPRSLRVDFALLDYRSPADTTYSYQMEHFDRDWTEIPRGSLPSAIYTNLPHGKYRLRLRATLRGMHPRTVETDLHIVVQPMWYETTAARIVGALLALLLIAALIHLRTLYLRRKALRLQHQIDEHTLELRAANQRLDELAGTDELTGVYNRRRFLDLARGERELAATRTSCMAVLDLDHFKQVNDTYGHLAGDAVLRAVIAAIRHQCRRSDLIGRYGGEEFVLCLRDTELTLAMQRAEQIRAAVAATEVVVDQHSIRITVSVGVASLGPDETIEQWLSRADAALYEAKRAGRNRCAAAP